MSALSLCLLASLAYAADKAGIIISIQGQVDATHEAVRGRARLRQDLFVGDAIHTGAASRAAILLVDETQLKVNANSTLELRAIGPRPGEPTPVAVPSPVRTILQILQGQVWVRGRGKAGFFEIQSPAITASIRGSEFDLAVAPDGESRIVVLEGLVHYRSAVGEVELRRGEAATARAGAEPAKAVVLRPDDAVQWSFYYPAIVSPRDYPFVSPDPQELERQLQQLSRVGGALLAAAGSAALQAPPGPVDRLVRRGEILRDLGRREEARAAFEEALRLDPGNPRARTGLGWLFLEANRPAEALAEFRQTYPRLPITVVGQALALYRLGRLPEATEIAEDGKALFPGSPLVLTQAAFFHLLQGRVEEARGEVDEALRIDPRYGPAHELLARVFLVQNQIQAAVEAAQRAVQANPRSPGALLTLSLVRQAEFQLDEALRLAQDAAKLDPTNAQPHMFEARLLFGMGRIKEAFRAIDRAGVLAREDPWVLTTRGFLLLAQRDVEGARVSFDRALELDSTQGLPYVGLGLVHIQLGELEAGAQAMLAATVLEPRNSLFHSYHGKALWEAKRREEALQALTLAKELDPKDPTPHLYSGIFNRDLFKPAQAIQDFYEAAARNDNRAVYRSRLLLDQDLATTNVQLSQAFAAFGQPERARSLAVNSLETDPSNPSAHLFFAGALLAEGLLGSTVPAGSELLQAFLLKPVNANALLEAPALGLQRDYTSLFVRPRLEGAFTETFQSPKFHEHNLIVGGGNAYVTFQQGLDYRRETAGLHKINDDLRSRIATTILKVAPTIDTEALLQFGISDQKTGDRGQDLNFFAPNDKDARIASSLLSVTGGIHHRLGPDAHLLLAVQGQRFRLDTGNSTVVPGTVFFFFPPFFFPSRTFVEDSNRGRTAFMDYQAALTHSLGNHHLTYAFDYYKGTLSLSTNRTVTTEVLGIRFPNTIPGLVFGLPGLAPFPPLNVKPSFSSQFLAALIQDTWAVRPNLHLTAGLQFDYGADSQPTLPQDTLYGSHWNPRVGVTYQLNGEHLFRAAAIRAFESHLASRLSPTQVAGFLIEHPGIQSARLTQYHLGWDGHFSPRLFLQAELFEKVIDVPRVSIVNGGRIVASHRFSRFGLKTGLNYTLTDTLSLAAHYLRFRRSDPTSPLGTIASKGDEDQVRMLLSFVHPSRVFAQASAIYTRQDLALYRTPGSPPIFWTTNLRLGYELPQKWGVVQAGALNLLRQRYQFRPDFPFLTDSLIGSRPDRMYFVQLSLNLAPIYRDLRPGR